MSIKVALTHRTSYRFDRTVAIHPHELRLRPAPHSRTPVLAYDLSVSPADHFINWQQDPFGNWVARLVFPEPANELIVTVDLVADLATINPFDFFVEESAKTWPFEYPPQLRSDLGPYLGNPLASADPVAIWLERHASNHTMHGRDVVDLLVDLNQALANDLAYEIRMEPGVQTPAQTLERASGSCRDSAWLLVAAVRHLGLAARFASGYLVQLRADQESLDGPSGPEADFTDLHAWAEVFIPGAGWVGLDPTSGLLAGEGHIPLACTPHPQSASPIIGATGPTEVTFDFSNEVRRFDEPPRVTLPYRSDEWDRIHQLGQRIDEQLAASDVRLTMGGEPTFVSIDDMEGDEWNTDADGEAKRAQSRVLAHRLAERFGHGPLIRNGQGKQYPGEALPRWEIEVAWRIDGVPVWNDIARLADPNTNGAAQPSDAQAVVEAIAAGFGLATSSVLAAYEDPAVIALAEARRPTGDPLTAEATALDSIANDDDETARSGKVHDLSRTAQPAGWLLPIHPDERGTSWCSPTWHLRRQAVYLLPGDSPVGLRLPLDSLTWSEHEDAFERSLFDAADDLAADPLAYVSQAQLCEAHEVPPTAITAEVRNGHIEVFLPPMPELEHGLALVALVEKVITDLDLQVVVVGYPLAHDERLARLSVTPDPGVVEVNVAPSSNWQELCDTIEWVDAEARLSRLGTEKFALDGTHTGTGGGSHLTLGAQRPVDSPFLRRPDLLRSLITFWQRHPSLSYLFSGSFIGPTSQSPRVDEGRVSALNDLEIAFAEMDRVCAEAEQPPLWLIDRLLHHLLVDLTGNTHRAEFCIDKLHSPDVGSRRLGLVELRAFEMPPHPKMAIVQALLVRCLVASFWEEPYREPLRPWGPALHDRFLLPAFVEDDLNHVVQYLAASGINFERAWLDPFVEFRFPVLGTTAVGDVNIELRRAIEPWLVLGEEVTSSGTSRYVDSSVERVQVTATIPEPGQALLCNGVPVPLRPTGDPTVGVAGVRFKAWDPWSSMHPTIDVHAPLIFELVDLAAQRSLGGCTYRVAHAGGRNYSTYPVNAAEAEARRRARFETIGHSPGSVDPATIAQDQAFLRRECADDYTLDLRRFADATAKRRAAAHRAQQ